jgi:hypothetical protein
VRVVLDNVIVVTAENELKVNKFSTIFEILFNCILWILLVDTEDKTWKLLNVAVYKLLS